MSKIYIIGGSGFIGTYLSNALLKSGQEIKILDKKVSQTFPDLTNVFDVRWDNDTCDEISAGSVIINLAAEHRDDVYPKSLYDDVNVDGAKNVCEFARRKKINTLIFTSSVAVYGFALPGTDEGGKIDPFNDYGRTKWEAEKIYKAWQSEDAENRTLIIIRPTVVFGEGNRGNVFNFLRQIASRKFVMVGSGENKKSMAYVGNVCAFIEHSLSFNPGVHLYNYIDNPDFTMNSLVLVVKGILGYPKRIRLRIPFKLGFLIGKLFDLVAFLTRKKFSISSIRVKKFCADSVYNTSISETGFVPPFTLHQAITRTVRYEFIEDHNSEPVYFSE